MVLRKPNLLDAFQAAAPEGKQAPPGKPPASAAGPFAHERTQAAAAPRRSLWSQMASDRLVQFALVVCLVGVGIAYYVGRTSNAAQAAGATGEGSGAGTILRENAPPAAQAPDPAEANRRTAAFSQSEHDKGFLDTKNKFTVRVALYPGDEAGKKAALADRDYLRGEGLPVVTPCQLERTFVVCVGYTATKAELDEILKYVTKLAGPKGSRKSPYGSAYIDSINHVVARK
jgi:hypothetical protein